MVANPDSPDLLIHASCVAWDGRAALITGASGSGKSSLALSLMAFGCALVADDKTILSASDGALTARSPDTIQGLIEARGVGLLHADVVKTAFVSLVVDLDTAEQDRLPLQRSVTYLGVCVPVYYISENASFNAAILQLLKTGRRRV